VLTIPHEGMTVFPAMLTFFFTYLPLFLRLIPYFGWFLTIYTIFMAKVQNKWAPRASRPPAAKGQGRPRVSRGCVHAVPLDLFSWTTPRSTCAFLSDSRHYDRSRCLVWCDTEVLCWQTLRLKFLAYGSHVNESLRVPYLLPCVIDSFPFWANCIRCPLKSLNIIK
jgi:hypothetical protein